jgi:peptidoglycan endopeptidase LytF
LIVCCCGAASLVACGGGSTGTRAPDSNKVPTATLPATLPAPQIINGAVQTGNASTYTIKSGDTLAAIADRLGVTLDDLRAANPGVDPARLTVGSTIKVPAGAGGAPPPTAAAPTATPAALPPTATPEATVTPTSLGQTYTVASGDIPETIAAKFGITVEALLAANPGADPTNLQIGQVLVIPPRP